MKMLNSVRTRLTLLYVGVLALVLLGFSAGVYALLARSLAERLDGNLRATLDLMTITLSRDLTEGLAEAEELRKTEGEIVPEQAIIQDATQGAVDDLSFPQQATAIFNARGELMAEKAAAGNLRVSLPLAHLIPEGTIGFFTNDRNADDAGMRIAVQRVPAQTSGAPYVIVVAQSLAPNAEELALLRRVFAIAVPLALLCAGLCGFFLARRSLAPVAAMSDRARRIGAENLTDRLPVANPRDELGQLATTFNDLLARLNASFNQQRQFMADASHELRTPLSVVQTAVAVTLEQPQRTEEEYRNALKILAEQTRRLTCVVEDMFTLARADAGSYALRPARFYLDELLAETARAAGVLAGRKGVTVEWQPAPETPYEGDEDLLRRMLLALLDNAIKYTPAGGRVGMRMTSHPDRLAIEITDTGIGIPLEAQGRIFERFYRVNQARSRGENGADGGAGLGLAIARWIAEAHRGSLLLERSDGAGSAFVIELPR
jgi:heavy metal sensor kinase